MYSQVRYVKTIGLLEVDLVVSMLRGSKIDDQFCCCRRQSTHGVHVGDHAPCSISCWAWHQQRQACKGFDKVGCCGINGTVNGGSKAVFGGNTRVLAKVMVALGFIWVLTETWMGLGT